jgi:hypothetical protein
MKYEPIIINEVLIEKKFKEQYFENIFCKKNYISPSPSNFNSSIVFIFKN